MPRRYIRNNGIINRMGYSNLIDLSGPSTIINSESMTDYFNNLKARYDAEAISKYSADRFKAPEPIYYETDIYQPTILSTPSTTTNRSKKGSSYSNKSTFVNDIYNSYYKAVRPRAKSDADARRQARFLTQKAALETGYGSSVANAHNYGGHKTRNGWLSFKSMDDFTAKDVALLDKKWSDWRDATTGNQFIDSINRNNGYGQYAPPSENTNYKGRYLGTTNRVNNYLNMGKRRLRCGGQIDRPKAWIGAAIGAATSILGGILQKNEQDKAEKEARQKEEHQKAIQEVASIAKSMNMSRNAQDAYLSQFRLGYKDGGRIKASLGLGAILLPAIGKFADSIIDEYGLDKIDTTDNTDTTEENKETFRRGGRRRLRNGVRITDGGYAIPMGNNTFLLRGGSHEDVNETGQTGIGLNIGGKEIEAEGGEVLQKTPREVRVFSDTMLLPNGETPADAIKAGANKDVIFNIQQSMNGNYNGENTRRTLRNIGRKNISPKVESMYMRNGGYLIPPVGRSKFPIGGEVRVVNGRRQRYIPAQNGNIAYWVDEGSVDNSPSIIDRGINWLKRNLNSRLRVGAPKRTTTGTRAINYNAQTGPFYSSSTSSKSRPTQTTSKPNNSSRQSSSVSSTRGGGVRGNNEYQYWKGRDGKTYYGYITPGKNGNSYNIVGIVEGNTGGGVRGNNYESNTIDAGTLLNTDIIGNKPKVDGTSVSSNTGSQTSPSRGASVSSNTGRRRLASRGATPNITPFTPPSMEREIQSEPLNMPALYDRNRDNIYSGLNDNAITSLEINNLSDNRPYKYGNYSSRFLRDNTMPIELGIDLASSIGGGLLTYLGANSIEDPTGPARIQAGKLATTYNIRPQLDEIDRLRNRMLSDTNESSSSVGKLQRRNYINTFAGDAANRLYGEKTNRELGLLNEDTMNQQQVAYQNAMLYNDYLNRLYDARSRRRLGRMQGLQIGLQGIGDAFANYFTQGRQNYSDWVDLNMAAEVLPSEGQRRLRNRGIIG